MKNDVGNFSKEMETVTKHLNDTIDYECSFSCSMRPACTCGKGGERSRCEVTGPKYRLGGDSDFSPGRSRDRGGVGEHAVLRADGQSVGTVGQGCLQLGADAVVVTCNVHLRQHVCDCHPNERPSDLPLLEENQNHKDSVLKRSTCDFRNSDSASVSKGLKWNLHP